MHRPNIYSYCINSYLNSFYLTENACGCQPSKPSTVGTTWKRFTSMRLVVSFRFTETVGTTWKRFTLPQPAVYRPHLHEMKTLASAAHAARFSGTPNLPPLEQRGSVLWQPPVYRPHRTFFLKENACGTTNLPPLEQRGSFLLQPPVYRPAALARKRLQVLYTLQGFPVYKTSLLIKGLETNYLLLF